MIILQCDMTVLSMVVRYIYIYTSKKKKRAVRENCDAKVTEYCRVMPWAPISYNDT